MSNRVQNLNGSSDSSGPLRIAAVSYLNARPLIYGLENDPSCELLLDVPAKLIDLLRDRRADVALLPVVDYQRMDGLCILPVGGIGSDDETLTVRIFSQRPIEKIATLACDIESHTSVALAKIILAEQFGIGPEFVELSKSGGVSGAARLLIGDKVICDAPEGFPHQLDLGAAWRKLTGLPFVFAAWMTRREVDLRELPGKLERAKREGLMHVEELIERYAVPRGWPAGVARQYLTVNLKYDIGVPELEAIRLFHGLAAKHGIIGEPRGLRIYEEK